MRILIASDLHGSAYYTRLLLQRANEQKPDQLLLLGDLLYHGPRNDLPRDYAPKEVIALLNERKEQISCVRGNCDTEVDQMVLQFPILADYALLFHEGKRIFASHGHHHSPATQPPLPSGSVLLNGHTHVPACERFGDCLYVNPGSTSIPKEDSPHSYLLLEDGKLLFTDLETNRCYRQESL